MTIQEATTLFPSKFTIACHQITIDICEHIEGSHGNYVYGDWNDAKLTIRIATRIKVDDEDIELSKVQLVNTFYHELTHCFLFFLGMEQNEMLVQSMANLYCEFLNTKV